LQLNLEKDNVWANHRINLPNGQVIECLIRYKYVPTVIGGHELQKI